MFPRPSPPGVTIFILGWNREQNEFKNFKIRQNDTHIIFCQITIPPSLH